MLKIVPGLVYLTLTLSLLSPLVTATDRQELNSGPEQVTLVELYTSEGCSSCPPADRWLNKKVGDDDLWTRFVPVALHIDYRDYIGWRDRFANPEYTDRQRLIASTHSERTIYTPEVVLNGKPWRKWRTKSLPLK